MKNYCKDHCSCGGDNDCRKKKCNSKSNSFVAASKHRRRETQRKKTRRTVTRASWRWRGSCDDVEETDLDSTTTRRRLVVCVGYIQYVRSSQSARGQHSEPPSCRVAGDWPSVQQQQQPFNGRLSGTTRVGRYQKKHSPAHTHPGQRTSFITFLHLQRSTASSLFSLSCLTVLSDNLFPGPQ